MKKVYIALATDERYIAPVLITTRSIVLSANADRNYEILIFSEKKLSIPARLSIQSAAEKHSNIQVVFIIVGDKTNNLKISSGGPVKGVTKATYLRFLLPYLLPDIHKILYMDVDTVVMNDVAELFDLELNGSFVGGVRDITGWQDKNGRCAELEIPDIEHYINAGVLLIDLDQFRKENLSDQLMFAASHKTYTYNDQDIINSICYGKICCLPYKCNVIVDYLNDPTIISRELHIDYLKETTKPIILHYAGRTKPWYYPDSRWSLYWWETVGTLQLTAKLIFKVYLHFLIGRKK